MHMKRDIALRSPMPVGLGPLELIYVCNTRWGGSTTPQPCVLHSGGRVRLCPSTSTPSGSELTLPLAIKPMCVAIKRSVSFIFMSCPESVVPGTLNHWPWSTVSDRNGHTYLIQWDWVA